MYISQYPNGVPSSSSTVVVNRDDAAVRSPFKSLGFGLLDILPVENRRAYFRGRNLGGGVTADQKAAISDGTFKDLFLGDYWTIGGIFWRIWDFDYWYKDENSEHHLVLMPDLPLYNTKYDVAESVDGEYILAEPKVGYAESAVKVSGLAGAVDVIRETFGGDALFWRDANFVSERAKALNTDDTPTNDYYPVDSIQVRTAVDLPSDSMLFGFPVTSMPLYPEKILPVWFKAVGDSMDGTVDIRYLHEGGVSISSIPSSQGNSQWARGYNGVVNNVSDQMQLALAAVNPSHINCGSSYMLRDLGTLGQVNFVNGNGFVECFGGTGSGKATEAEYELGVRPVFGITGD